MSKEAARLALIGKAMCRKIGIDRGVIAFRMGPEHIKAMHDILDGSQGNSIAEEFLDWLLSLASEEFDAFAETATLRAELEATKDGCDEAISDLYDKGNEIVKLRAELAEAKEDGDLLDWVFQESYVRHRLQQYFGMKPGDSIRDAIKTIRAEMKEEISRRAASP